MAGVKGRSGGPRPGSGGARPGAGRKPHSWYIANGLPLPKGSTGEHVGKAAQRDAVGGAMWDDLRQALLMAEALLGAVYMQVKTPGPAKEAKESLTYVRKLLETRMQVKDLPESLVEAERLRLMVKRFVREVKR